MPFPSPSLPAPGLLLYQWQYGGLAFGGVASSTYQVQSTTIDMPDVAAGDVQRALDQGEFAGLDVLPGKDVTIVQVVTTPGLSGAGVTLAQAVAIDAACQALGGVLGPAGITEQPLYVQMASGCFASMARPRKHNCPWDINRAFAGGAVATSLLHCTDPRWYAVPTKTATVGLPSAPGGLVFPVTFPVSFGGGGVGGLLNVYNNGYFEMRPQLVFTGPCTNPVATNLSIAGNPSIGFVLSLNAGDTLTVDMDFRTAVLESAGTTAGSDRKNALIAGSTWWNLLPYNGLSGLAGPNIIEFNTADLSPVAGTLTVNSADAYLTL